MKAEPAFSRVNIVQQFLPVFSNVFGIVEAIAVKLSEGTDHDDAMKRMKTTQLEDLIRCKKAIALRVVSQENVQLHHRRGWSSLCCHRGQYRGSSGDRICWVSQNSADSVVKDHLM